MITETPTTPTTAKSINIETIIVGAFLLLTVVALVVFRNVHKKRKADRVSLVYLTNPRRACARVTVVVLCVASRATTRQTGHTNRLSIVVAPELIWRFSYNGFVSNVR